jgi:hypothetical protein
MQTARDASEAAGQREVVKDRIEKVRIFAPYPRLLICGRERLSRALIKPDDSRQSKRIIPGSLQLWNTKAARRRLLANARPKEKSGLDGGHVLTGWVTLSPHRIGNTFQAICPGKITLVRNSVGDLSD